MRRMVVFAVYALFLTLHITAFAQETTGSLAGTVTSEEASRYPE